jgi:hypothetical protein
MSWGLERLAAKEKQSTVARSELGPFYLSHSQVQHLMHKVLSEPWAPFATRHGDDCIAIAIGRHSSISHHISAFKNLFFAFFVWTRFGMKSLQYFQHLSNVCVPTVILRPFGLLTYLANSSKKTC